MTHLWKAVFALLIVLLLVPSQYAKAATYDEIRQEVNFEASGNPDATQNALDETTMTNYDTWNPEPSGAWFGGWSRESLLRLTDVPSTDYSMALAQVFQVPTSLVQSGSSFFVMRLPVHTPSTGAWSSAVVHIYTIDADTNWTFSRNTTTNADGDLHNVGAMRLNFTAGDHELIYWSHALDPADASITDGDDWFTRDNRTYLMVNAPIHANQYYLVVTYVLYAADRYVNAFIQPDSLDGVNAVWNRSTIARYNELAPDSYTLKVNDFNASVGYSFDFRHGFGQGSCGLNIYVTSGTYFYFWSYLDPATIDRDQYLTFQMPFMSTVDNTTWDLSIYAADHGDQSLVELYGQNGLQTNGFILVSMTDTLNTNWTASGQTNFTGWFYVSLEVKNDTRLRLSLWDTDYQTTGQINDTWFTDTPDSPNWMWGQYGFDSANRYNPMDSLVVRAGAVTSVYHFRAMHSLTVNAYYWSKTVPVAHEEGGDQDRTWGSWDLIPGILWGLGWVEIGQTLGSPVLTILRVVVGPVGSYIYDRLVGAAGAIADWAGRAWDKIVGFFEELGAWLYRIGQRIVGAIKWFIETVTYYASVILGILVLVFALIILFVPLWFSAKLAQVIVLGLQGRHERAVQEAGTLASMAQKVNPRGGG